MTNHLFENIIQTPIHQQRVAVARFQTPRYYTFEMKKNDLFSPKDEIGNSFELDIKTGTNVRIRNVSEIQISPVNWIFCLLVAAKCVFLF